jgi:hypothetical protein
MTLSLKRRVHMQHDSRQQEQQTCILHEDRQPFIEEIAALRSLAGVAGVADHLLTELDDFEKEVEHLDASAWERKEVRNQSRNELVHLSLAVLRAYGSGSY